MSTGLKAFIIIACIMAGIAMLSFGGYLAYRVASGVRDDMNYNQYVEDFFGDDLPFEIPDQNPGRGDWGDSSRPSRPGRNDGESSWPQQEIPQETPDDNDEMPDFGADPPSADEPLPDIDLDPEHEGITIEPKPDGEELSAQEVYQRVVKSTVTVAVSREGSAEDETSTGTGIIATEDGYVITNSHVVLNSKSVRVKLTTYDGQEYRAIVVGCDRTTDVAVLKTEANSGFTPAVFGDADSLTIGDSVIAIGNPGGARFSGSMTGGYVSGLNREVGTYSANGMTYIQTDAAINPGNSGGPLVNMYGQVVGINSSKIVSTGYEGMGFAIPVSRAKDIINQLLSGGYVEGRVRLGVVGQDSIYNTYLSAMGVQGFVILEINEDSAFADTEAETGDVITAIEGEEVTDLEDISNLLLKYAPGDTITITLTRIGESGQLEKLDVDVTLLADKGETQR